MTGVNFKNSVIALAIGLVTVSCGGGRNKGQQQSATAEMKTEQTKSGGGVTAASFVGKWEDNQMGTLTWELKADGTGVCYNNETKKSDTFTWKVSGNKATLDFPDGNFMQFEYIGSNEIEDYMSRKYSKK